MVTLKLLLREREGSGTLDYFLDWRQEQTKHRNIVLDFSEAARKAREFDELSVLLLIAFYTRIDPELDLRVPLVGAVFLRGATGSDSQIFTQNTAYPCLSKSIYFTILC